MSVKQIDGYKIRMNQKLGTGSYGTVYVGESDTTHKKVAIKVLPKQSIDSDQYLKSALFQQIKIMQCVKNPNIVQFVDVMESSKNYYIIQQLCDGDITKLMKPGKELPQYDCINMLTQISNGFLALVRQGIVHRDLKPANIMIKDNILKIGDFGFAKKIPNQKFKNKTIVGTPLYMSLQILKSESYTSKCDIWALGFIFYELLHGTTPWTAKSQYQLVNNITNTPLKIKRKDLSANTVDFIKKCLTIKQDNRLSWDQLFLHPIFDGFFDDKGTNNTFQNRLKQIMNDLRFYIKSNNLDLTKILYNMGYSNEHQELDFQQYFNFLKNVNPQIKREQALYVFKQTDTDHSNSISILEIEKILNKHSISFVSTFKGVPKFSKQQKSDQQTFSMVSQAIQEKVHSCFSKLYRIIEKNKMTLQRVFNDFDKKKDGKLSEKQFIHMMNKLDKGMPQDQILQAFNMIDQDGSKTIEYDQLNKYYCKVNGIPYTASSPKNQPMDIQSEGGMKQSSGSGTGYSSGSNGYMANSNNPFFTLQHQNSYPGSQPYYNPQMGYYPPPPPNYMPPPQQQQQPSGLFGNFIFNKLNEGMYGSNKNIPSNYYGNR